MRMYSGWAGGHGVSGGYLGGWGGEGRGWRGGELFTFESVGGRSVAHEGSTELQEVALSC